MVFANGGLRTQLEVALRREEIIPAPEHLDLQTNSTASPCNAVHINMHTPLAFEQVQAIADREGWMAPVCDRGGAFNVYVDKKRAGRLPIESSITHLVGVSGLRLRPDTYPRPPEMKDTSEPPVLTGREAQ